LSLWVKYSGATRGDMSHRQSPYGCCYLFTVSNSGLLSMQQPRPASHAHFCHSHIPGLICGVNSSIDNNHIVFWLSLWRIKELISNKLFQFASLKLLPYNTCILHVTYWQDTCLNQLTAIKYVNKSQNLWEVQSNLSQKMPHQQHIMFVAETMGTWRSLSVQLCKKMCFNNYFVFCYYCINCFLFH